MPWALIWALLAAMRWGRRWSSCRRSGFKNVTVCTATSLAAAGWAWSRARLPTIPDVFGLGSGNHRQPSWNLSAVAENFLAWLESGPVDVGNTCRRGILRFRDRGELSGDPRDDEAGNGACMRNLPVVLATLRRPELFELWSLQQSRITHHHPLSDAGTLALGRIAGLLIDGQDAAACREVADGLVGRFAEFAYDPYPGRASGYIVDTVQTVLHHFFNSDSVESCLVATVNQGGDADTTGALAGMLAGAKYGVDDIPQRWLHRLDSAVAAQIRSQTDALLRLSGAGSPG
nr:ADP-ribosylglycohydrolase family protein [Methylomonas koyamae]